MSRFVLLYHDCPPDYARPSHWDLMLEAGDALRTWALARLPRDWLKIHAATAAVQPACPPVAIDNTVGAEMLGDHRLAYLEYEGPLSGSRGQVTRVASGTFATEAESPERWQISVAGSGIRGTITLRQSAPDSPQWTLAFQPGN